MTAVPDAGKQGSGGRGSTQQRYRKSSGHTWGVSRTGTRPRGDLARNSGDLLSLGWLNSGTSSSTPLYSAAIRTLKARKFAGFVQSFCFAGGGDKKGEERFRTSGSVQMLCGCAVGCFSLTLTRITQPSLSHTQHKTYTKKGDAHGAQRNLRTRAWCAHMGEVIRDRGQGCSNAR